MDMVACVCGTKPTRPLPKGVIKYTCPDCCDKQKPKTSGWMKQWGKRSRGHEERKPAHI